MYFTIGPRLCPRSVQEIGKELGLSEYKVRKGISALEEHSLVDKIGNGPSTKYTVRK